MRDIIDFSGLEGKYDTVEQCLEYLADLRWPDGFYSTSTIH
jgi:hypothetical protein